MPNLILSETNGGSSVASQDLENARNGQNTSEVTLYLRHDLDNPITGVTLYLDDYSGSYTGTATAALDLAEILEWGDKTSANTFGGFQINQDAIGGFPDASWPTWDSHARGYGSVFNNSLGAGVPSAIELSVRTGAQNAGEIQDGDAPNVRFQARVQVPQNEDVVGVRQFDLVATYTYTS